MALICDLCGVLLLVRAADKCPNKMKVSMGLYNKTQGFRYFYLETFYRKLVEFSKWGFNFIMKEFLFLVLYLKYRFDLINLMVNSLICSVSCFC